jgi:hypothetical protein
VTSIPGVASAKARAHFVCVLKTRRAITRGINLARPQSLPKELSNDDQIANPRVAAATERRTATAPSECLRLRRRIRVRHWAALDRDRGDTISGKNGVAMNHLAVLGFLLLLAAILVALDFSLALRAIDRLAQSEGYTDIQNAMTVTNATIRL